MKSNRHIIHLHLSEKLFQLLERRAYRFGLPETQYIHYILLKDLDPREKQISRKTLLDKRVDD